MASIVDVGVATGDMGLVLALGARMVALAAVAGALGMGYARFSAQVAMGFGAGLRDRPSTPTCRTSPSPTSTTLTRPPWSRA